MQSIVIIEDDESIREMLRYYFASVGYEPRCYESGEAYFEDEGAAPLLYILDVMLPGMDGLAILKRLRETTATTSAAVIMLTARTQEMDKVRGLEAGADDYVVKPFGIMELQARVKAVLRRSPAQDVQTLLSFEDLTLDPAGRTVHRGEKAIELTYKEFELLALLLRRQGTVLTRDDILAAVWDYDFAGETRTVDMHIKTLRQKLGEGYIQTVRGVGYKM